MKSKYRSLVLSMLLIGGTGFVSATHAAGDQMSKAEARQMVEDKTPQAKYNTSRREAQAAYSEAVSQCKAMRGADKNTCMKEAKTNLQNDLADAKKMMSGDTSVGSSPESSIRSSSGTSLGSGDAGTSGASPAPGRGMTGGPAGNTGK